MTSRLRSSLVLLAVATLLVIPALSSAARDRKPRRGRAPIERSGVHAVGEDRIVRTPLPRPKVNADGSVYVPAGLKIVPTQEIEREIENPADEDAAPTSGARIEKSSPWGISSVSPNARANDTTGDPAGTTNSENAIAAFGSLLVAGWNDGRNFGSSPGASGYASSTDGGATWLDGGVPPATSPARYEGDPSLTVDNSGNFYYANLYTPNGTSSSLSVNHGKFTAGVFAWDPPVQPVAPTDTDFYDKEWIAADPVSEYVYLTYTHFLAAGGNQIDLVRSTDHGATWSAPLPLTSPMVEGVQGSRVAVGPSGEVQVIYFVYDNASGNNFMRTRRSTTFAASFGPEITLPTGPNGIFSNYGSGPPGFNRAGGIGFPSLAIDRSAGPNSGRVYATWEETFNFYLDPLGSLGPVAETEANNTSATANPIVIGQAVNGTMSSSSDQDWFSFSGTAGQGVIIYLIPGSGDGFLRLFAGGGATANRAMLSYLGGGQALVVYTLPSTGTYYFRVLDASGASSGTYTVYTGLDSPDPGDEVALDTRDAILQASADGTAWGARKIVNDDPPRYDNTFPEVAVDACGQVFVDWMDHRGDAANGILTDVYYSSSPTAGATFNPSIKVNDGPSVNWNLVSSNLAPNMGDYWNLVADGANVYANFADGRGGTPDSWVAKIVECAPTPTLVSLIGAEAEADHVDLRWFASDAADLLAAVERHVEAGDWETLGAAEAHGDGELTFVDRAVVPGGRYEYRLAVSGPAGTDYFGQVWVDVPGAAFALRPLGPMPITGDLDVAFSLPKGGPAKLELLDVGGRVLRSVAVVGGHDDVVRLGHRRELPAGVYMLRLTQDRASRVVKAILLP